MRAIQVGRARADLIISLALRAPTASWPSGRMPADTVQPGRGSSDGLPRIPTGRRGVQPSAGAAPRTL